MASSSLIFDLLVGKNTATPAFVRFSGAADLASAAVTRAQKNIETAGAKMTKSLTLPIVGAAAIAVDQAAKYNRSLATIANATDQSTKQMSTASSGLLKIATSTGASLGQLTDGLYTVEKGGLRGSAALATVKAAAQGAAAEGADLGVVTNTLTSIMASYGSKIGSPVQAMDMLVRGSGLAKTTLQDFSGSLSTVVPLAAKAGISFAQVAGAVDTLTQHGTSAQEATQELANLIRNLQAPSQVAQKAMQQVGLSVVDVTSRLGSRGLIGTLAKVEDAVTSHLGKSGLVAVDVFKKSASASADLQTMIKSMPTDLAKVSQGLLTGAVSIKSYQSDAKSLGGQAGASALQFLSLFKSSKGFNDLLKSGQPGVRTAAAQLKDMLGGSTALNAALQLGGHSAKYFADASTSVAKAAQGAGADVLGWGRTQALFTTKVAMAKANLQVLAVELGTALLPAVTKIASAVGTAAHSFDGLSHTQKEVLGWGLGVAAAIGPMLTIGARLSTVGSGVASATSFIAGRLATLAGATETQATAISLAAGRIGTALGAAGLGVAVGELTKNSDNTKKAVGVLGSALAGAAIGSSGGPWGAALGAAAGGIGALATSYLHLGGSAKSGGSVARAALASQNQAAGQLEQSLEGVASAYDLAYKQQLAMNLTKTNVGGQNFNILGLAKSAGINPQSIVSQIVGTGSPKQLDSMTTALRNAMVAGKLSEVQWDAVTTALGLVGKSAATAERNLELQAQATGKSLVPTNQLGTSLKTLRSAIAGTGTALDTQSAAGLRNRYILGQNVTALNSAAKSELSHGDSVGKVARMYAQQITALETNATKLGLNKSQVDTLIRSYASMPKSVLTQLEQKGGGSVAAQLLQLLGLFPKIPPSKNTNLTAQDYASPVINGVAQKLAALRGKTIDIVSNVITHHTNSPAQPAKPGVAGGIIVTPKKAAGGTIVGPGTGTSDSVLMWGSNGEEVINAKQSAKHRGLLKAINAGIGGFASGGTVTKKPVYTVNGTKYATKLGAENARARADKTKISDTNSAISGLLSTVRNLGSSASDLSSASAALVKAAKAQGEGALAQKLAAKTLYTLGKRRTAVQDAQLRDSVRNQLGSAPTAATAYDKLANAQQAYTDNASSVSTATSAFDITQLGVPAQVYSDQPAAAATAGSILAALTATASKATAYATLLKRLIREGMPQSIVQQLAAAGPAAFDQATALAAATPKQIAGFKSQTGALSLAGSTAGKATSDAYYKTGVSSAQGLVNGLLSQEKKLDGAISKLADGMVTTLKHKLGIHSPSAVMFEHGAMTGEGYRLGVESKLANINRSAAKMAGAAQPPADSWREAGSQAQSNFTGGEHHWHIHGVEEPEVFARRVKRRVMQEAQGFY